MEREKFLEDLGKKLLKVKDRGEIKNLITGNEDVRFAEVGYLPLLSEAAKEKHEVLVEELLKIGANPNETDMWGGTPFLMSCMVGSVEIAELMIKHGGASSPPITGDPLIITAQSDDAGTDKVLALLLKKEEALITPNKLMILMESLFKGHFGDEKVGRKWNAEKIELLVSLGLDVNERLKDSTALHLAALANDGEAVKALIRLGADRSALSGGETALMSARRVGADLALTALEKADFEETARAGLKKSKKKI